MRASGHCGARRGPLPPRVARNRSCIGHRVLRERSNGVPMSGGRGSRRLLSWSPVGIPVEPGGSHAVCREALTLAAERAPTLAARSCPTPMKTMICVVDPGLDSGLDSGPRGARPILEPGRPAPVRRRGVSVRRSGPRPARPVSPPAFCSLSALRREEVAQTDGSRWRSVRGCSWHRREMATRPSIRYLSGRWAAAWLPDYRSAVKVGLPSDFLYGLIVLRYRQDQIEALMREPKVPLPGESHMSVQLKIFGLAENRQAIIAHLTARVRP